MNISSIPGAGAPMDGASTKSNSISVVSRERRGPVRFALAPMRVDRPGSANNRTELILEDVRVCTPSMKTKESHGKLIRTIDTTIASLELKVL